MTRGLSGAATDEQYVKAASGGVLANAPHFDVESARREAFGQLRIFTG